MKKFNPLLSRLLALGLGLFLSAATYEEPVSFKDPGSFFMVSNPSSLPIGDVLKGLIKQSKKSIDIQIYALSDPGVIKLLNSQSLLFPVSIHYDAKASSELPHKLTSSITLDPYAHRALMHRKICCIDEDLVLLGSANYTPSSLYWHYNALFGIHSQALQTFLKANQRGFKDFKYGRAFLLPDFKNQALTQVVNKINQAKNTLHLAMFSLTHPVLIKALLEAAQSGIDIYLYIDGLNLKKVDPELALLFKKCKSVFTQKYPVLLHHKLCLIDQKILIAGSANWTKAGFKKNEEILVIFDKLVNEDLNPCIELFKRLEKELEPYIPEKIQAA